MQKKRAILFVNGQAAVDAVRWLLEDDDFLVAVDGGLRHVEGLGRVPNVLLGDLDSVDWVDVERLVQTGVEIVRYPQEKDETDLELALRWVVQRGYERVRIVGGLGGRIDQTLGNLALLLDEEWCRLDVRLDDGLDEVWLIEGVGEIEGRAGDVVSLLPWNGAAVEVWTDGLAYALSGETLYPQRTRGISNRLVGRWAQVRVSAGRLLCVHTRQVRDLRVLEEEG